MPLVNTANGKNVSKVWNDAVYVQNSTANTRLVFINEADVYTEPTGASYSFVTVVDAVSQKVGLLGIESRCLRRLAWSRPARALVCVCEGGTGGQGVFPKVYRTRDVEGGNGKRTVSKEK